MKISFNFDTDSRSIILTPENELEVKVMAEMHERTEKGSQLKLRKIVHECDLWDDKDNGSKDDFIIELKVNGH